MCFIFRKGGKHCQNGSQRGEDIVLLGPPCQVQLPLKTRRIATLAMSVGFSMFQQNSEYFAEFYKVLRIRISGLSSQADTAEETNMLRSQTGVLRFLASERFFGK